MPIYEFRCGNCEKVSEVVLKFSDPYPETCPTCNKGPLTKLISKVSFQLKGGGWYSEGYSSAPKPKENSGSTEGAPAEGSKEAPKETPKETAKETPAAAPATAPAAPAPKKD